MLQSTNILLIGPMGAGKTTLGKRLATQLNIPFIDVDEYIVEKTGVDVNFIFYAEGEIGFRKREHEALKEILENNNNAVIATGGGCVLTPENRQLIMCERLVVHLDVSLEVQYLRVKSDHRRPILQVPDLKQKLSELREQRHEIYKFLADMIFINDDINPNDFVEEVKAELGLKL